MIGLKEQIIRLQASLRRVNTELYSLLDNNDKSEESLISFIEEVLMNKLSNERVFVYDSKFPDAYIGYVNKYCLGGSLRNEVEKSKLPGLWINYLQAAIDNLIDKLSSSKDYKLIKMRSISIFYKDSSELISFLESNAYTEYFGIICKAFKDRNRQAKAICVKALNSGSKKKDATADEVGKNESAADIFADVEII